MELWQGEVIPSGTFVERLPSLEIAVGEALLAPLDWEVFLAACGVLSQRLTCDFELVASLEQQVVGNGVVVGDTFRDKLKLISDFLTPDSLRIKRNRELGEAAGRFPRRFDYRVNLFEANQPLGLLVHIASGNSITVGFLSVIEGLMAGNVNVLKSSRNDPGFAAHLLSVLAESDSTGTLAPYLYCTAISSQETADMKALLSCADGIAVWGGEDAVASVQAMAPSRARVIPWGHKISFGFVAHESARDLAGLERLAEDCVWNEQQACSSPQVVYFETEDLTELHQFAEVFAEILGRVSDRTPRIEPPAEVAAEITSITEVHRIEALEGERKVLEASDGSWRILLEPQSPLQASPLFRTVWLKPLTREQVVASLRPMRQYLQTVGLVAPVHRLPELSQLFFVAGVQRVRSAGSMAQGYLGEPHDGVYALARYTRRTSVDSGEGLADVADFSQFLEVSPPLLDPEQAITNREDFRQQAMQTADRGLLVRSGGSSSEPVFSVFDYEDYRHSMRFAADGLLAAGLEPRTDRCVNMFASGKLYGGFLSFFTILEDLQVLQFPEGQHEDTSGMVERFETLKANVLLGMPASIMKLFTAEEERLARYRGIKKIYFGGDHLNPAQAAWLKERFGVEIVRSACYGSNELGPMGYQAWDCLPGEHYLHHTVMQLEILDLEEDRPAGPGAIGRLVFTPIGHRMQAVHRYDIGDLGRWVNRPSQSGRRAPRFQLLGKKSDLIPLRQGQVHYFDLNSVLSESLHYHGELQIHHDGRGEITVLVRPDFPASKDQASQALLERLDTKVPGMREEVDRWSWERLPTTDLKWTWSETGGKLIHVCQTQTVP